MYENNATNETTSPKGVHENKVSHTVAYGKLTWDAVDAIFFYEDIPENVSGGSH